MKEVFERLWNEYFSEECAVMETDEERVLARRVIELHEKVNDLLSKDAKEAVEKYVNELYGIEALLLKKAFFKGCEFAFSFFLSFFDFNC